MLGWWRWWRIEVFVMLVVCGWGCWCGWQYVHHTNLVRSSQNLCNGLLAMAPITHCDKHHVAPILCDWLPVAPRDNCTKTVSWCNRPHVTSIVAPRHCGTEIVLSYQIYIKYTPQLNKHLLTFGYTITKDKQSKKHFIKYLMCNSSTKSNSFQLAYKGFGHYFNLLESCWIGAEYGLGCIWSKFTFSITIAVCRRCRWWFKREKLLTV